ncbi:MAG: Gfo/Idh/MocA family protein [Saccharofermentanales bacterium]
MKNSKHMVAIVGYGGMGNWHRELLESFDQIECAGTYDINPARQQYARSVGLKTYESFEDLLADDSVDIVTVATPNDTHKKLVIAALEAGKAVVCEKPVTLSSADLIEMTECADRCGAFFTVHQNRRWDEDYLIMKKIFEDKLLGDIFNIESRVHGSRGIPGDWRGRREQGGGMVLDWGVHILDQLLQMVPEKIVSVYARMNHVTNFDVDDGFKILLTFESGKTALAEVGTSNFITLPRWYMQGENGTAIIDDFSAKGRIVSITDWDTNDAVPVKTAAGLTKTMAPRTDDTIKETSLPEVRTDIHDFYKNVVDVLQGKAAPCIRHDELLRCMRLMEAAFRSDALGQVVPFE